MNRIESRTPKSDDRDQLNKAINLIYETIEFNNNIEPTLWVCALYYILAKGHQQSGFTSQQFKTEMDKAFDHYKDIFYA